MLNMLNAKTDLTDFRYVLRYSWREQSYVFFELMTPEDVYEAEAPYRAFLVNKPDPPEHAEFMARAAELYPDLPPGAQQNALHCDRTMGKGYAKRYVANARARQTQNSRGMRRPAEPPPYVYQGVRRDTPKRQREEAERVSRYNDYMAAGKAAFAKAQARERAKSERRLAKALAAVAPPPVCAPRATTDSSLVVDLVALLKSKAGATYAEAASALGLKPKGDKPHQSPAAQVRALVRDKVRLLHNVVLAERNSERGGAVYRLQDAA